MVSACTKASLNLNAVRYIRVTRSRGDKNNIEMDISGFCEQLIFQKKKKKRDTDKLCSYDMKITSSIRNKPKRDNSTLSF